MMAGVALRSVCMRFAEFQKIGQDLFVRGLISSHGGNLSVRSDDRVIITRRGSQLNHLTERDLVETGVAWNDRSTPSASSELAVHRAIYQQTRAHAIVHAHPIMALALSLFEDEITPLDAESSRDLGTVPIIGNEVIAEVRDVVDEVAKALHDHPIVVVRGHGSFAIGQLLDEAHRWTSLLEDSCRLIHAARALRAQTPEEDGKKNHGLRRRAVINN
jgi:L-fuculose-phosphate aldolase